VVVREVRVKKLARIEYNTPKLLCQSPAGVTGERIWREEQFHQISPNVVIGVQPMSGALMINGKVQTTFSSLLSSVCSGVGKIFG
jgi:hypothetical protein